MLQGHSKTPLSWLLLCTSLRCLLHRISRVTTLATTMVPTPSLTASSVGDICYQTQNWALEIHTSTKGGPVSGPGPLLRSQPAFSIVIVQYMVARGGSARTAGGPGSKSVATTYTIWSSWRCPVCVRFVSGATALHFFFLLSVTLPAALRAAPPHLSRPACLPTGDSPARDKLWVPPSSSVEPPDARRQATTDPPPVPIY